MMILIIVGTHVASLDATARRCFYASLVGPRSFISENDSSTGEGLLFIEGEGETRTRSQCHADGTTSEDHLAELRRTLSFLLLFCRTNSYDGVNLQKIMHPAAAEVIWRVLNVILSLQTCIGEQGVSD